jgi:hypothetical protein
MTGYQQSRRSVEQLSDWITHYYEGSETIAGILLSIRNKNRKDLKNIFTGRYPLDRGTGNYVNALLDLYSLNASQSALDRAGLIIKQTAHPHEDIASKDLDDVENSWFYTIFLQSLIRFLLIKENSAQLDSSFYHVGNILLHYTDWMVEHEYPYLEKPENRPGAGKVNPSDHVFAKTLWSAIKRTNLKVEINWITRRSASAKKLCDKVTDR